MENKQKEKKTCIATVQSFQDEGFLAIQMNVKTKPKHIKY